ncbi:3-deoxy-7-phosphoheptulonate synthase [candidate division FCPU426 bacterium]|nr:3-deoxy-7-phosphoheptulonate synthase [candidate division FCPU426 bacterium]
MIIVMRKEATEAQINHLVEKLKEKGLTAHISRGTERTIVGAIGDERVLQAVPLEAFPGVEKSVQILQPFKLVSREFKPEPSVVSVGPVKIGGGHFGLLAGPCSVEDWESLRETALKIKASGANLLRGGAFKPRTSPYAFQGLGEEGLKLLARAREETGLPVVTEVMNVNQVELVSRYADMLQIGARNMQNFDLLKAVGQGTKPVLLKRGLSATIKEWLMSAEYILSQGNYDVVLCERGIRTFETYTRNTLDLAAVPAAKELSHLPVVVDPSHATGRRSLVGVMARAAVAAGADGISIEVHPHPEDALSDGDQSLLPEEFDQTVKALEPLLRIEGKKW